MNQMRVEFDTMHIVEGQVYVNIYTQILTPLRSVYFGRVVYKVDNVYLDTLKSGHMILPNIPHVNTEARSHSEGINRHDVQVGAMSRNAENSGLSLTNRMNWDGRISRNDGRAKGGKGGK